MHNEIRKIIIDIHKKHKTPIRPLAELADQLINLIQSSMVKSEALEEFSCRQKESRKPS